MNVEVVKGLRNVRKMNLRKRIKILINELNKRGKNILVSEVRYLKVDDENWEKVGSEYELYERLMQEWEAK